MLLFFYFNIALFTLEKVRFRVSLRGVFYCSSKLLSIPIQHFIMADKHDKEVGKCLDP